MGSKKKYTQYDLRRLMQEQKLKLRTQGDMKTFKVDSPLSKYNDLGQLTCILCKNVVKSDAVWKVHINSKSHKIKVKIAKQSKGKSYNEQAVSSLLKGSNDTVKDTTKQIKLQKNVIELNTKTSVLDKPKLSKKEQEAVVYSSETLPEGFFDDPAKDAKLRNMEYKDPNQDEWERFQREMKEEATLSNAIIAGEQDEATAERQIKEIDEQMERWNKVLDLERKKELVSGYLRKRSRDNKREEVGTGIQSDDDKNDAFEEFPDWRAKKFTK